MKEYDIALSFAGEDRYYVDKVAHYLKQNNIKVFYDKFEETNLWGKNLYDYLRDIYQNKAEYTVIFISNNYKNKVWTNHERESAQARAFKESSEYILPAKFENTDIKGILDTIGYIDLKNLSPKEFALKIIDKLKGKNSMLVGGPSYEYLYNYREDVLELDGSQLCKAMFKIKANSIMPSFANSISSISKSLFPFKDFTIQLLEYECNGDNQVSLIHTKNTDTKQSWKITINPPLLPGEIMSFSYQFKMKGNRIMCREDIIEVAKKNRNLIELVVRPWRKISIPTKKWSWKITLPNEYQINNPSVCVLRNKLRVKQIEVELEKAFTVTREGNRIILGLSLENPPTYFGYGFSWWPPMREEYDKLCKKNGITPYHGNIT